uniref:IF rod domain-containing protein n=1 Tax=Knipowitschia caucasica TaxID=637954 RepID=A0AAV2KP43_KNICA
MEQQLPHEPEVGGAMRPLRVPGPGLDLDQSQNKPMLQNLNGRLCCYLQQVRCLESSNQALEQQIEAELHRRSPGDKTHLKNQETSNDLRDQISVCVWECALLKLHCLGTELTATDYECTAVRTERQQVEAELTDLKLLWAELQERHLTDLNQEVCAKEAELRGLKAQHHQDVQQLLSQDLGVSVQLQTRPSFPDVSLQLQTASEPTLTWSLHTAAGGARVSEDAEQLRTTASNLQKELEQLRQQNFSLEASALDHMGALELLLAQSQLRASRLCNELQTTLEEEEDLRERHESDRRIVESLREELWRYRELLQEPQGDHSGLSPNLKWTGPVIQVSAPKSPRSIYAGQRVQNHSGFDQAPKRVTINPEVKVQTPSPGTSKEPFTTTSEETTTGVSKCETEAGETTPEAETTDALTTPEAETTDALTAPEAETTDALTAPEAETTDALTTPEAETTDALTTPEAETTDALMTPEAETTDALTAPEAETTDALRTPEAETTDALTAPEAETTDALTTPEAETTDALTAPETETTDALTAPEAEITDALTTPEAETTDALTAPEAETTDALTAPEAETTDALTAPEAEITDALTAPEAETTDALTTPEAETTDALTAPEAETTDALTAPEAETTDALRTPIDSVNVPRKKAFLIVKIIEENMSKTDVEPLESLTQELVLYSECGDKVESSAAEVTEGGVDEDTDGKRSQTHVVVVKITEEIQDSVHKTNAINHNEEAGHMEAILRKNPASTSQLRNNWMSNLSTQKVHTQAKRI